LTGSQPELISSLVDINDQRTVWELASKTLGYSGRAKVVNILSWNVERFDLCPVPTLSQSSVSERRSALRVTKVQEECVVALDRHASTRADVEPSVPRALDPV